MSCSNIVISGKRFDFPACDSLSIVGGRVYIDGVEHKPEGADEKPVKIEFHNCTFEQVTIKQSGSVDIKDSSVGPLKISSASVSIHGNVTGSVSTSAGSVTCKDVSGNVKVSAGSIVAGTIHGTASVSGGTITDRSKRTVRTSHMPPSTPKRYCVVQPSRGVTVGSNMFTSTTVSRMNVMPGGIAVQTGDLTILPPPPKVKEESSIKKGK